MLFVTWTVVNFSEIVFAWNCPLAAEGVVRFVGMMIAWGEALTVGVGGVRLVAMGDPLRLPLGARIPLAVALVAVVALPAAVLQFGRRAAARFVTIAIATGTAIEIAIVTEIVTETEIATETGIATGTANESGAEAKITLFCNLQAF